MIKKNRIDKLDFLRGISIIAVLLFHFDLLNFRYGYLGVDIFFLVSGFILTKIYFDRINNFKQLLNFYIKRFKRLFPLLSFITILTLLISIIFFLPSHLIMNAKHAFSAITFASNIIFWGETNYFDVASHYKPLLHTWSLSLEFQYYICVGIFWLFINKIFRKNLKAIIIILLILIVTSISGNFYFSERINFNFYMLPFRGWEFGIGMLGAFLFKSQKLKSYFATYNFDFIFLILIIFIFIDFFSLNYISLLPQLIICFIVFCYLIFGSNLSKNNFIKSVSLIGTASYPIYLVHWPILVIYSYSVFREIQEFERLLLLILSILMGFIASIVFEKNRNFGFKLSQSKIFLFKLSSISTSLFFLILGVTFSSIIILNKGFESRFAAKDTKFLKLILEEHENIEQSFDVFKGTVPTIYPKTNISGGVCIFDSSNSMTASKNIERQRREKCIENIINNVPKGKSWYTIIGDSNGEDFFRAISKAFPSIYFTMLRDSGCAPIQNENKFCFLELNSNLKKISSSSNLTGIILASRFVDQDFKEINKTLNLLSNLKVKTAVVGSSLLLRHNIRWLFVRTNKFTKLGVIETNLNNPIFHPDISINNKILSEKSKDFGLYFINRISYFCNQNKCKLRDNDHKIPLIYDTQHLSRNGINFLKNKMQNDKNLRMFLKEK